MANAYVLANTRLTLRVNPNAITWNYTLKKVVRNTKGGRIVQLLGVDMGSLVVDMEIGLGGVDYLKHLRDYFSEMAEWHSETKRYGRFVFPDNNWDFRVLFDSVTIEDSVDNVTFPVKVSFNIQEDISGVVSSKVMRKELEEIQEGVGYTQNKYNYIEDLDATEYLKRYGIDGSSSESAQSPTDMANGGNATSGAATAIGAVSGVSTSSGASKIVSAASSAPKKPLPTKEKPIVSSKTTVSGVEVSAGPAASKGWNGY